jgi:nucleotide-binding universal stress UspA family protein
MLSLRRILFPTDYTVCSDRAFGHAAFLAERTGADLRVLHVDAESDGPERAGAPREYAAAPGVAVAHETLTAESPEEAILASAADADLIVMGTHGRTGLRHAFLGSVAERTLRTAPCPVLTVSMHAEDGAADGAVAVRRILAAVDFSDERDDILRAAAALAEVYDAVVDVVHAVFLPNVPDVYGVGIHLDAMYPQVVENAQEALLPLVERFLPEARRGAVLVPVGTADTAILQTAEAQRSDLIVIATHGRTGLKRIAFGSVAESVLRRAACPVCTLPSAGRATLRAD